MATDLTLLGQTEAVTRAPTLIDNLESMVAALKAAGQSLNPASRVPNYIRALGALLRKPVPLEERTDIDLFLNAVGEGQLIYDTYLGLTRDVPLPGWLEHFIRALDGRPELGGPDAARNKMVELYTAAAARGGGFGVGFAEPDVRITDGDTTYGAAAKRVASLEALDRRVPEGAAQILGQGLPGFVIVDLTIAVGFHTQFFAVETRTDVGKHLDDDIRPPLIRALSPDSVRRWLAKYPGVFGVTVIAYSAVVVRETGKPVVIRSWLNCSLDDAPDAHQAFYTRLAERLRVGPAPAA